MTSLLFDAIKDSCVKTPDAPAIRNKDVILSYEELLNMADKASQTFSDTSTIGLMLDNSPAWVILDLACLKVQATCVPIPGFFSDGQILHAISDAGLDTLITDQPERIESLLKTVSKAIQSKVVFSVLGKALTQFKLAKTPCTLPNNTVKITYTSGTTGQPKGVCLCEDAIAKVAKSLEKTTQASNLDIHLNLLPLSTLLENIAGVYVPLLSGACIFLPSLAEVGFTASAQIDFTKMLQMINNSQASTLILTPELLRGLLNACENGLSGPTKLRFVAVGGALVPPELLKKARTMGIPVYEGYGLSECASVVSLNSLLANKLGSVGKPLAHVGLLIEEDGEIFVKDSLFLGYTNQKPTANQGYLATGDIGYLDEDGYLYITGRKKNIFITSFGRNVSPEWVERELTNNSAVFQAAVYGEAKPFNVAVIVPNSTAVRQDIAASIIKANQTLPDYAQIKKWVLAKEAFSPKNGLTTANFRLKRAEIYQEYHSEIESLYKERKQLVL